MTDTVTRVTNVFSLATKNSCLVATLVTRFLYDLDLNLKLKQIFHVPNCITNLPPNSNIYNNIYIDFRLRFFQTVNSDGWHHTMSCFIYIVQTAD